MFGAIGLVKLWIRDGLRQPIKPFYFIPLGPLKFRGREDEYFAFKKKKIAAKI